MRANCVLAPEQGTVPAQLRDLANAVRRIGNGYRDDPETIAIQKETVATRLVSLTRRVENNQDRER